MNRSNKLGFTYWVCIFSLFMFLLGNVEFSFAQEVTNIERLDSNPTNASTVRFLVTFSGGAFPYGPISTSDFELSSTVGGNIASISSTYTNSTITVEVENMSGNGTIRLDLKDTDNSIDDNNGISLTSNTFTTGETYNFDNIAPGYISVTDGGNSKYKAGETITLTANLGETGLLVTANLSVLDTDFNASQAFTDNNNNTYSFSTSALDLYDHMQEGNSIIIAFTATDAAGNTSYNSSLSLLLDKTEPSFDPVSQLAADNSYLDIHLSEPVYTLLNGTGALVPSDLKVNFQKNSGNATNVSISSLKKPNATTAGAASALVGGETDIRVFLTVTGTPNGNETIVISAADGSSVYDIAGNNLPSSDKIDPVNLVNQCTTVANAGNDKVICKGASVDLGSTNTASGGSGFYSYEWRIPANGSTIISSSSNPTVSPTATTTYEVTVINSNGCRDTDQITVTVNPLPIVSFEPDSTIFRIDASVFRLDNNNQVSPTHTTGLGGVFSGNGIVYKSAQNQYYFDPSLANIGDNVITYTYTNASGCVASATKTIRVIEPTGAILNLLTSYCPDFNGGVVTGLKAASGAVSAGRTFESLRLYKNGEGYVSGPLTDANNDKIYDLDLSVLGAGNFSIAVFSTYNSGTPTGSHLDTYSSSFVYSPGETPVISNLEAIYCSDNEALTLSGSISSYTNSVFTGEGVNSNSFNPDDVSFISNQFQKNITITYSYKDQNNCTGSINQNVKVNRVPDAPTALSTINYCSSDLINPIVATGVNGALFSWYKAEDTGNDANFLNNGSQLNPVDNAGNPVDNAVSGLYEYWVTQSLNSCESPSHKVSVQIFERSIPKISGIEPSMCVNEGLIDFEVEAPSVPLASEVIKINGSVVAQSEFNTGTLGTGKHKVKYIVTNTNNCSDSTEFEFEITPTPIVSFSGFNSSKSYCYVDEPITLVGSPAVTPGTTGIFTSSTGGLIENNGNGIVKFSPKLAALASGGDSLTATTSHTITYTFIDQNGCSRSRSYNFTVYPMPNVRIEGFNTNKAYCYNDAPIEIAGFPADNKGKFTGNGITNYGNGKAIFTPSLAASVAGISVSADTVSKHIISYSYTNNNGCTTVYTDTILVYPKPNLSIGGFNSSKSYCFSDAPFQITGYPTNANGTFTGNGITNYNNGTAMFSPVAAATLAAGTSQVNFATQHTITYHYTNKYGCTDSTSIILTVNPLPNPEIVNLNNSYCQSENAVILKAIPAGGIFSGNNVMDGVFNPGTSNLGIDSVVYVYTDSRTLCSNQVSELVRVRPNPNTSFSFSADCNESTIQFQNTTTITATDSLDDNLSYEWNFGDFTPTETSFNASHHYTNPNLYQVKLTTETEYGCSSSSDTLIAVGAIPVSNFIYENNAVSDTIIFKSTSTLSYGNIYSYRWNFGDGVTLDSTEVLSYQYNTPGIYQVSLETSTNTGCTNNITKTIYVLPEISSFPYLEDFETQDHGWLVEGNNSSWEVARPLGMVIDKAASGSMAYITNAEGTYYANEQSFVNSPYFDISSLKHPFVSLKVWSSTDAGFDGAVLQISADQGNTWEVLGTVNEGIGWYNSSFIVANPGNQESSRIGWSKSDSTWQLAKFSLQSYLNKGQIRFRIAFASNGDNTPGKTFDGFAFDDFQIGERNRIILVEHFTNVNNPDFFRNEKELNEFSNDHPEEILSIHYHTDYPSNDPFNKANPMDPSGRALFYGFSDTPKTILDGAGKSSDFLEWIEPDFQKSVLEESPFDIKIDFEEDPKNQINFTVKITANKEIKETLFAHIAIVEKAVTLNGKTYYNVLREMLPSAGGTKLSNFTWEEGVSETIRKSWYAENIADPEQIVVVVFIQNRETKKIYQAAAAKPAYTPSIITGLPEETEINQNQNIFIFPNPTNASATITLPGYANYSWKVFDNFGRTALTGQVKNRNKIQLNTHLLAAGIYVVQIEDSNGKIKNLRFSVIH